MYNQLSEEMVSKLKSIAVRQSEYDKLEEGDDFNPADFSGGNFDDAFGKGEEAGEIDLAREILSSMGIVYE